MLGSYLALSQSFILFFNMISMHPPTETYDGGLATAPARALRVG